MFTSLYETLCHLVQPILNYGAGLWGTKQQRYIRNVQNKEYKFYLGVNVNTSNVAARGDMGWLSSLRQQHVQVFHLWIHLQNHPDDRTCKLHKNILNTQCYTIYKVRTINMSLSHKIN